MTLNIPHTKGTFPQYVSDTYNYVGPFPALWYYDPDGLIEPLPGPTVNQIVNHKQS